MSNKGTHWRQILDMPYLNGSELDGEVLVTIENHTKEEFYSPSSKSKEPHTILHFKEMKKGMVLNPRKAQQIERILETPFIEDWIGKTITLFAKQEKHFGEWYPVITVKRGAKKKPILNPESEKWAVAIEKLKTKATTMDAIKKSYELSQFDEGKLLKAIK